jgi:hypothetical protein
VSSGWRAVVDSYWLLHPYYVLPMAVADIFVNYMDYCRQHLLVRPGCNLPAGSLDFVPREKPDHWSGAPSATVAGWSAVRDHCNGLVLYDDGLDFHVVNPVTRRWARPPPHLVFEPVVSRHHEVVLIPLDRAGEAEARRRGHATATVDSSMSGGDAVPSTGSASEQPCAAEEADQPNPEDQYGSMEWLPRCMVHVLSSRTWRCGRYALLFGLETPPERWPTCGSIPWSVVSFEFVVVHFCNICLVGGSQKKPILVLRK